MKPRAAIILGLVVITAFLLRIAVVLFTGTLFSTDVWPLYRIVSRLVSEPATKIWDASLFGWYHNRWPGLVMSAAVFSIISGANVVLVFEYVYPLILSTGLVVAAYVVLSRIGGKRGGIVGTLYLSTSVPLLVFSSAVLKEVYSFPMLLSMVFLAYWLAAEKSSSIALIAILSLGMSVSHPLASIMGIGLLASSLTVFFAGKLSGLLFDDSLPVKRVFVSLLIFSSTFSVYYVFWGGAPFRGIIGADTVLAFVFYGVVVYAGYLFARSIYGRRVYAILAIVSTLLALWIYSNGISILPGMGGGDWLSVFYAAPVLTPLMLLGCRKKYNDLTLTMLYGFYFLILVLVLFIVFGSISLSWIFHRIGNYIVMANSILVAITSSSRCLKKGLLVVCSAFMASLLVLAGLIGGWDTISYYWVYYHSEVTGFKYVDSLASPDVRILGDAKIHYFFSMVKNVDQYALIRVSYAKSLLPSCSLAVLYRDNVLRSYYVANLEVYKLDCLWHCLLERTSLVYSGGRILAFMNNCNH